MNARRDAGASQTRHAAPDPELVRACSGRRRPESGALLAHAQAALGDPDVLRAVIGGALYLTVLGALGIGLGTILRRTAGTIATLVSLLLILPLLAGFLPTPWNDDISKYLPGQAGGEIFRVISRSTNALSPWTGFAVFCAYALISLIIGAILLTKRDA